MMRSISMLACVLLWASSSIAQPAGELPPNHPPIRPGAQPSPVEQDTSEPSSELPRGTVVVSLIDPAGKPLPGRPVSLGIVRQSVAEGESRDARQATTDGEGRARFDGLSAGSKYNYRVSVRSDPAEYASEPFTLRGDMGQSLSLHVYPVTTDPDKAMLGVRSFILVEPRDDVFQIQMLVRVINVGSVAWVPQDVVIDLPRNAKAFNAEESMDDTRVVAEGSSGARLVGTYGPGQHDVSFRFQLPNDHDESTEFSVGGLPPHLAELRIVAEAAKGMGLEVPGMKPAQIEPGEAGQRMLATGRQVRPGETEMRDVTIKLTGIPTPGPGRWYALVMAAGLAGAGLFFTTQAASRKPRGPAVKDVIDARAVLLKELVLLERARQSDKIGPRTYEKARQTLISALARLEAEGTAAVMLPMRGDGTPNGTRNKEQATSNGKRPASQRR